MWPSNFFQLTVWLTIIFVQYFANTVYIKINFNTVVFSIQYYMSHLPRTPAVTWSKHVMFGERGQWQYVVLLLANKLKHFVWCVTLVYIFSKFIYIYRHICVFLYICLYMCLCECKYIHIHAADQMLFFLNSCHLCTCMSWLTKNKYLFFYYLKVTNPTNYLV